MTRATLTCLACLVVGAATLADQPPQPQPADIRQTMRSIWREDIAAPTDRPTDDLSRAVRQLQATTVLPEGCCLAIEPMVNAGGWEVEVLANGWTVVTKDRRPSAHWEDTVAVTREGPLVITG